MKKKVAVQKGKLKANDPGMQMMSPMQKAKQDGKAGKKRKAGQLLKAKKH